MPIQLPKVGPPGFWVDHFGSDSQTYAEGLKETRNSGTLENLYRMGFSENID